MNAGCGGRQYKLQMGWDPVQPSSVRWIMVRVVSICTCRSFIGVCESELYWVSKIEGVGQPPSIRKHYCMRGSVVPGSFTLGGAHVILIKRLLFDINVRF